METLREIWERLARDGYKSDKGDVHSYIEVYEELFKPYRNDCDLLEIGLFNGDSFRLWKAYFVGSIEGVDCSETPHGGMADLRPLIKDYPHHVYIFDALNKDEADKRLYDSYDIIIEDAGHQPEQQIQLYNIYKKFLSPDGIYIIEDVQDLDRDRTLFQQIDPSKKVTIIDNRKVKGRYDDVLIIIQ